MRNASEVIAALLNARIQQEQHILNTARALRPANSRENVHLVARSERELNELRNALRVAEKCIPENVYDYGLDDPDSDGEYDGPAE
jgi:hypothetical protein